MAKNKLAIKQHHFQEFFLSMTNLQKALRIFSAILRDFLMLMKIL